MAASKWRVPSPCCQCPCTSAQASAGSRINRGFFECLQRAWQHQFLVHVAAKGWSGDSGNGGDGRALGFFGESTSMGLAANQSHRSSHDQDERERNANDQQGFSRGSGRKIAGAASGFASDDETAPPWPRFLHRSPMVSCARRVLRRAHRCRFPRAALPFLPLPFLCLSAHP